MHVARLRRNRSARVDQRVTEPKQRAIFERRGAKLHDALDLGVQPRGLGVEDAQPTRGEGAARRLGRRRCRRRRPRVGIVRRQPAHGGAVSSRRG